MAASASIPYPELNRPEIAITGASGCSRFSSAITTRLDDGAGGFEVASHGPANRGSAAVRRESGVFDELRKNRKWKTFCRAFSMSTGRRTRVIVAGSSRLDITPDPEAVS
jgi:hypothetical protein